MIFKTKNQTVFGVHVRLIILQFIYQGIKSIVFINVMVVFVVLNAPQLFYLKSRLIHLRVLKDIIY